MNCVAPALIDSRTALRPSAHRRRPQRGRLSPLWSHGHAADLGVVTFLLDAGRLHYRLEHHASGMFVRCLGLYDSGIVIVAAATPQQLCVALAAAGRAAACTSCARRRSCLITAHRSEAFLRTLACIASASRREMGSPLRNHRASRGWAVRSIGPSASFGWLGATHSVPTLVWRPGTTANAPPSAGRSCNVRRFATARRRLRAASRLPGNDRGWLPSAEIAPWRARWVNA